MDPLDGSGNTPLMDAIRHGHKEVQAALRAAGGSLGQANVADKLLKAAAENDLETLQVRVGPAEVFIGREGPGGGGGV